MTDMIAPPAQRAAGRLLTRMPVVAFGGVMEEARLWAEFADRDELRGYAAACFAAMPASDREAFIRWAATLRGDGGQE